MNKEERFLCLLDAQINDSQEILKLKNDHDTTLKRMGMILAYEETKNLYEKIFKEKSLNFFNRVRLNKSEIKWRCLEKDCGYSGYYFEKPQQCTDFTSPFPEEKYCCPNCRSFNIKQVNIKEIKEKGKPSE